jgi:microcystin-dependent protein
MAKGIIQYSKDIVNDSFASTETTYSSVKIEQLLSTLSSDMYKVSDKLSMKTVGGVQTINQSDLPITPTTQLKLNQIVYDTNKILGIISAIDTVNLTVDVTTIHSNEGEGGCEIILGCFNTPPTATSAGDMYYNTTNGLLYTADASLTWDVGSLPVEKITYLNLDDHKIYAFTNNQFEIYGGSEVEISSKIDNALTEIASGPEKGLYVKDLEAKLNQISSIQRVNIGNAPEYMLIYTRAKGTPSSRAVSQGTYNVTSWHNDLETNMDSSRYDVTSANGYVILKKGITYELEFSTLSNSLGASYYIRNEAGQNIGNRGYMSANLGKWSDESIKGIYTPEKDEKITFEVTYQTQFFAADLGTTTLSTTGSYYMDCSHIFIRQINPYVVDPVEHVNIDKGIEDTPVGHIMSTAGETTPPHYLPCDGSIYNIADYPYLSEYFKTELGAYNCYGGDGITTFAVPNIKNIEKLGTTSIANNAWASSIYSSNYPAAKAFNGILDTNSNYWQTVASPTFPVEIGIDLESGYVIKKYVLHNYGWSAGAIDDRPTSWTFEGSINKADWDILDTQTNYIWTTGKEGFNIPNVRPYRYYRFIITATIGGQKSPILNQVELFVNTENPSHIKYEPTYFFNVEGDVTYEYGCETILGCFDTAPAITAINDMYYNTTDGRIYTSVDGVSWDTGTYPQKDILYVSIDDKKIYAYTNNQFEVYGGNTLISPKADNALEEIADGTNDGLYVKDLELELAKLNWAQKTVNEDLEYFSATGTENGISLPASPNYNFLPYLDTIKTNLDSSRYTTQYITLKAGKTYQLSFGTLKSTNNATGSSYHIVDSLGNQIGNRGYTGGGYGDSMVDVIYTPTSDIKINPMIVTNVTTSTSKYFPDCSFFMVKEVSRTITIDPVEYVDSTKGIEDTPVGSLVHLLKDTSIPKHYLACDGTVYNITDYPYLSEYIKTEFGSYNHFGGDGITTFAVPSLGIAAGETVYSYASTGNRNDEDTWNATADCTVTYTLATGLGYNAVLYVDGVQVDMSNPNVPNVSTSGTITLNKGQTLKVECGDAVTTIKATSLKTIADHWIKYEPTYYMELNQDAYINQYCDYYDTNERIVGKWTDGKPVYRKVVPVTLPSGTGGTSTAHGISNMDTLVNYSLTWYDTLDGAWYDRFRLWEGSYGIAMEMNINGTNINIISNKTNTINWTSRTSKAYSILEYTKTTDAPNSFDYGMIMDQFAQEALVDVAVTDAEVDKCFE